MGTKRLEAVELRGLFPQDPIDLGRLVTSVDAFKWAPPAILARSVVAEEEDVRRALPNTGVVVLHAYRRHFIDLRSSNYQAYFEGFGAKSRSTLRRKIKKFQEHSGGQIDFRWYRAPDDVMRFLESARGLSARTYQHALFGSGLPATSEFVNRLTELAGRGNWRAAILAVSGEPVAYLCLPAEGGVIRYEWVGYDQRHSDLSPGAVLQLLTLERLFEENEFDYFDFTEGDGSHKEQFGREARRCLDLAIAKPGSSAERWLNANQRWNTFIGNVNELADRLGLKARLKRLIRQKAGGA